ncbi:MAG: NfeD family protein [Endozoicomonas sp.]
MDFLNALQPWHWIVLAFLLLGLEALGTGGFLLGSAAAGFLLGLLLWLMPDLGWPWQFAVFGIASLTFTLAYWKFFRRANEHNDHPELNNRAQQLVGRILVLEEDLVNGQGRIQVGDTFWKVRANGSIEKGATVQVVGADAMTLLVERQL